MNITWFWHKCWVHNMDGEKYYLCTMGEYQMILREQWDEKNVDILWKPMIAKWNDDIQIFEEWISADAGVSLDVRPSLDDAKQYMQKWYTTYVLAEKLILGEIDATPMDFSTCKRTDWVRREPKS